MPHVKPLDRADLADFEPQLKMVEASMGFVPNSVLTMARRPAILQGFMALAGPVLNGSTIGAELVQLVAHIASTAAGCQYCQAHTGSNATRVGASGEKIAAAWEFETSDLFSQKERAALRLARDSAQVPNGATPEHFDALSEHFDDGEITEIVAVISLFGYLNRWNDTMATTLEDEAVDFGEQSLSSRGWSVGKHA